MESPLDVLYPADESFMPDMLCGKESPVHTLNGGTSKYEETGMEKLIFIELLSIVGYMSNIYEYVTVLCMMQDDWDRNESLAMHGGLVQYVFKRIISLVGCVTGGSGRRCQTFITKDFKLQDIRETCHGAVLFLCYWEGYRR
jgi:hypothetical protein